MQYLLTHEEYSELIENKKNYSLKEIEKLQKFCTFVADNLPIIRDWDKMREPSPWGCILSSEDEWYCDDCPSQEICPYKWKHWSK